MAPRPVSITARQLREADQRIEAFRRRFGEPHILLAYHAAFPAVLTADLAYSLWATFRQDIQGGDLDIPWEATADLLLSRLNRDVGTGIFELDEAVQLRLRAALAAHPRLGAQRVAELAAFLLEYVQPDALSEDQATIELVQAQQLAALTPTNPTAAELALAKLFLNLHPSKQMEWIRLAGLVHHTTGDRPEFAKVRQYAEGMRLYAYGDQAAAAELFAVISANGATVQIAELPLRVPDALAERVREQQRATSGPPTSEEGAAPGEGTVPAPGPRKSPAIKGEQVEQQRSKSGNTRSFAELFVGRDAQIDRFRRSLDGRSGRKIILVAAEPGMGKSWLLRRFAEEGRARGAYTCLIDFEEVQSLTPLSLIRRFRDSFGREHFERLTAAINEVVPFNEQANSENLGPAKIDIGSTNIGDTNIGNVAGASLIRDNIFMSQSENPLLVKTIEHRVSQIFFELLAELVVGAPALFLFDNYDRTSKDTEQWTSNAAGEWIQRELLGRIRSGALSNTVTVLAGRHLPEFDATWGQVAGRLRLEFLSVEDVSKYLRKSRGLNISDREVQALYDAVQGNPQLLGIIGDNLEAAVGANNDDEW